MAIYNQRAEFSQEQFESHFQKRNSTLETIYGILRFLVIIVQNLYCIPSYLVLSWLILLPASWFKNGLYYRLENYLYNSLVFIVSSWSLAAGLTVVETGDEFKHLIEEPDKHYPDRDISLDISACKKRKSMTCNGIDNNNLDSTNHYLVDRFVGKRKESNLNDEFCRNKPKNGDTNIDSIQRSFNNYKGDEHSYETKQENKPRERTANRGLKDSSPLRNKNTDHKGNMTMQWNDRSVIGATRLVTKDSALNAKLASLDDYSPKKIQDKPRILLLCNHISTADVPLMMQTLSTLTNQSVLWVLDAQFKLTNFGVVCGSHGDFFVSKSSYVDGSLREHVLKYPDRNLLVLFPEGGFLRKRIEGSDRYAKRNNLPLTTCVTHPRFGAFKDLIDPSVGVTHIVDATLIYDNIHEPISMIDIGMGNKKEPAILHFKVYKRSEINPSEEWLRSIWLEKDKMLSDYYKDKSEFLKKFAKSFRVAKLDWFKVLCIHLFYLLVCYLAIIRLFNATSATMLKARELYYSTM